MCGLKEMREKRQQRRQVTQGKLASIGSKTDLQAEGKRTNLRWYLSICVLCAARGQAGGRGGAFTC